MAEISEVELRIILEVWQDSRSLIAALKTQRADAAKWAVTINIAIATASAVTKVAPGIFLFISLIVAAFGCLLVWHYNARTTRVRAILTKEVRHICKNIFDFNTALQTEFGAEKGAEYDKEELYVFYGVLCISALPALVILLATG